MVSLARLELSTSSMPSVIVHNALGGQRQFKPWVFLPAILGRGKKEESSQNCSDSEDSSSSQSSSTTEAEDIESDLESLEEHYYSDLRRYTATLERDFSQHLNRQQLNNQEWNFHGGREGIQRFLTLPTTWPLARLMFPIKDLRRQMETLLQTYCFEIEVTCAQAREQDAFVRRMALHLVQYLA